MRINKQLQFAVTIAICAMVALPHNAFAAQSNSIDGIRIHSGTKNVRLANQTSLQGAIVDANGQPQAGAPVVLGQKGEAVAKASTDNEGRYAFKNLKPGTYHVVSFAGAQTVQAYGANAPADAVDGVVQVIDEEGIARGMEGGNGIEILLTLIKNPLFWSLLIALGIIIPLALDDDDAS